MQPTAEDSGFRIILLSEEEEKALTQVPFEVSLPPQSTDE